MKFKLVKYFVLQSIYPFAIAESICTFKLRDLQTGVMVEQNVLEFCGVEGLKFIRQKL